MILKTPLANARGSASRLPSRDRQGAVLITMLLTSLAGYAAGADAADAAQNRDTATLRQLARYLLEKHTALVAFFSWGRGYQFYTAVVYPYERKDGKLWLLMGMSEGILKLDTAWALESEEEGEGLPPVPQARKKPKVTISK